MHRHNIFLDLDNTIICSEEFTPKMRQLIIDSNYSDFDFIDSYVTVARPHLQFFLDFLFDNFNVGIWTAASKRYASFIFERFIHRYDQQRNLRLLLYNVHCDLSVQKTSKTKSLCMLWDHWEQLKPLNFSQENTYIIDDLKEVYSCQPENCFRIKQFNIKGGKNDIELLLMVENLKKLLKE